MRLEDSLELLTQNEWDSYLEVDLFDKMYLDKAVFGISDDILQNLGKPRLSEIISEHNNKVGSLRVTYALCRHYYDKGIPDDPWYISPGNNGESIQYMPNFTDEHWGRQYWFNYFSNTYYLRISAIWDSVIEIINHYLGYDFVSDLRLRSNVFGKLKNDNPDLLSIFTNIQSDPIYTEAQRYRNAAAHGTSMGEIRNTVKVQSDTWTDVFEKDENGHLIIENGKVKTKRVKAKKIISVGAGEYTNASTIFLNMEAYAKMTGDKIQDIVSLLAQ